jgi:hypothetical protein
MKTHSQPTSKPDQPPKPPPPAQRRSFFFSPGSKPVAKDPPLAGDTEGKSPLDTTQKRRSTVAFTDSAKHVACIDEPYDDEDEGELTIYPAWGDINLDTWDESDANMEPFFDGSMLFSRRPVPSFSEWFQYPIKLSRAGPPPRKERKGGPGRMNF